MKVILDCILISACLAAVFFSPLAKAKVEPFTFAFDCNKQTKLCSFGRLPKSHFAWLLNPEGTCRVVASEQFMYNTDSGSFAATRLIEKTNCPISSSRSILYLPGDYKDSEFFKLQPVADAKVKNQIQQQIKTEGVIKKVVSDKDKSGPDTSNSLVKDLEKAPLQLSKIDSPSWANLKMISLINGSGDRGMLLAKLEGKPLIALSGGCGQPSSVNFFRINQNRYIYVRNTWCNSDDEEEIIYQLKDDQIELVYSNDELSDLDDK